MLLASMLHIADFSTFADSGSPFAVDIYDVPTVLSLLLLSSLMLIVFLLYSVVGLPALCCWLHYCKCPCICCRLYCVGCPVVDLIPTVACLPTVAGGHATAIILAVACCWRRCCCLLLLLAFLLLLLSLFLMFSLLLAFLLMLVAGYSCCCWHFCCCCCPCS
jgi:hypothetical protein